MRLRNLLFAACIFAASGCARHFDVLAANVGDRLVFAPRAGPIHLPYCIHSIGIAAETPPSLARAAANDDRALIGEGVFWANTVELADCPKNRFPINYGAALKGTPFKATNGAGVEAKGLLPGVIYEIDTAGNGKVGEGRFRITAGGTVENLPLDDSVPAP